jgi:hypothetical protein
MFLREHLCIGCSKIPLNFEHCYIKVINIASCFSDKYKLIQIHGDGNIEQAHHNFLGKQQYQYIGVIDDDVEFCMAMMVAAW